ncbi:glycosyltransferase family 5 protein [Hortaea werneckii]|nr:glycosyltransferase family 5 protein [Hortaea werneckii]
MQTTEPLLLRLLKVVFDTKLGLGVLAVQVLKLLLESLVVETSGIGIVGSSDREVPSRRSKLKESLASSTSSVVLFRRVSSRSLERSLASAVLRIVFTVHMTRAMAHTEAARRRSTSSRSHGTGRGSQAAPGGHPAGQVWRGPAAGCRAASVKTHATSGDTLHHLLVDLDRCTLKDLQVLLPLSNRETLLSRAGSHGCSSLVVRLQSACDGHLELVQLVFGGKGLNGVPPSRHLTKTTDTNQRKFGTAENEGRQSCEFWLGVDTTGILLHHDIQLQGGKLSVQVDSRANAKKLGVRVLLKDLGEDIGNQIDTLLERPTADEHEQVRVRALLQTGPFLRLALEVGTLAFVDLVNRDVVRVGKLLVPLGNVNPRRLGNEPMNACRTSSTHQRHRSPSGAGRLKTEQISSTSRGFLIGQRPWNSALCSDRQQGIVSGSKYNGATVPIVDSTVEVVHTSRVRLLGGLPAEDGGIQKHPGVSTG